MLSNSYRSLNQEKIAGWLVRKPEALSGMIVAACGMLPVGMLPVAWCRASY